MNLSIETNLDELGRALSDYVVLSGKSMEEALRKHGSELAFRLKAELKGIAPPKGKIRSDVLAVLAGGSWPSGKTGIRISASAWKRAFSTRGARSSLATGKVIFGKKGKGKVTRAGKQLTVTALAVKYEISLRESARGFLGASATYPGVRNSLERATAKSKFGPILSEAGFTVAEAGGSVEFKWGGFGSLSASAAEGLTKAKGEAAIDRALVGTLENIGEYVTRKILGG